LAKLFDHYNLPAKWPGLGYDLTGVKFPFNKMAWAAFWFAPAQNGKE